MNVIKPIEWREKTPWHHVADTILGPVSIKHYQNDNGLWSTYASFITGTGKSQSLDEAKSKVESDFRVQVMKSVFTDKILNLISAAEDAKWIVDREAGDSDIRYSAPAKSIAEDLESSISALTET